MMVKIGVIFMSFSNPTCHSRDTADFSAVFSGGAGGARAPPEFGGSERGEA